MADLVYSVHYCSGNKAVRIKPLFLPLPFSSKTQFFDKHIPSLDALLAASMNVAHIVMPLRSLQSISLP